MSSTPLTRRPRAETPSGPLGGFLGLYVRALGAVVVAVGVAASAVAVAPLGRFFMCPLGGSGTCGDAARMAASLGVEAGDSTLAQFFDYASGALTWDPLVALAAVGAVLAAGAEARRRRVG